MKIYLLVLVLVLFVACKKDDLNLKYNKLQITLETIQDAQNLLDNPTDMNYNRPYMGELGADNFYIPSNNWGALNVLSKNCYIWEPFPYGNDLVVDWYKPYSGRQKQ